MNSTLLIGNLHCPSCSAAIESLWTSPPLAQDASKLSVSILTGLVKFNLQPELLPVFVEALTAAGFEVVNESPAQRPEPCNQRSSKWYETAKSLKKRAEREHELQRQRKEAHQASCRACQGDLSVVGLGKAPECSIAVEQAEGITITTILIGGMTCSSCIGSVERILAPATDPRIREVVVTLIPGKAVVTHSGILDHDLVEMLEDGGYEAQIVETRATRPSPFWVESTFVIEGMTCASCVGSMDAIVKPGDVAGLRSSKVTLLPPRATIVHDPSIISTSQLIDIVEDGGYGAELVSSAPIETSARPSGERQVKLRVDGMFCDKCSDSINALLHSLVTSGDVASFTPIAHANPYTTLIYEPRPPSGFTLRTLQSSISSLGPFSIHPVRASDVLTTLARSAQARESRAIFIRLLTAFVFAIPTFVIAIVAMSLLPQSHRLAAYFSTPIWGNASRGTVALFVLATPVQFGVGLLFYVRAWKSLRGVWKRGGEGRWRDRLLRWGSMDSLVALGTTAGWSASVGFMVIDVRAGSDTMNMPRGGTMGYFDSSVFLVLFIMAGRYLEGLSRRRTGDAVEALGSMKTATGILLGGSEIMYDGSDDKQDAETVSSDVRRQDIETRVPSPSTHGNTQVVEVDFLERGDVLLIPAGSSVPLDSVLVPSSASSNFDESSLTGEARPVLKLPSDDVFAGSNNLGPSAVTVCVSSHAGETMLDTIVKAVGDAMARKAGIERVADLITGYFVPFVVGIAGLTFGIWVARGYAGGLPRDWLNAGDSWALFAIQFTVAVLVVACPCGIGLAAPTAQMVGTGLAARLGIIPYGGGEAFQNATQVDCVVFDKTGTLTRGEFRVADHHLFSSSKTISHATLFSLISTVEEVSVHPISLGIKTFCRTQPASSEAIQLVRSEEVPGRGLEATAQVGSATFEVLVGNQRLLDERGTTYEADSRDRASDLVESWGNSGSSVVFVAVRPVSSSASPSQFVLVGIFAVHDPPREEASLVIAELERQGIAVFLCTGDNAITALAVARTVGIAPQRVFAGVLPVGKQDCIQQLQRGAASDALATLKRRRWSRLFRKGSRLRLKVLFVGDGINDIVALTQSDVGVSMGTGAAVARTNSDFCLLSSNLLGLITLLALARATYNKILTNFAWAIGFNAVLIPIAAGAFYDLGRTRLPPVWASLAMALSSVSVVSSSLLLRYTFRIPEVVRRNSA